MLIDLNENEINALASAMCKTCPDVDGIKFCEIYEKGFCLEDCYRCWVKYYKERRIESTMGDDNGQKTN